jgi:outer membrane protein OmpA-like peptidoglycan-associated protein
MKRSIILWFCLCCTAWASAQSVVDKTVLFDFDRSEIPDSSMLSLIRCLRSYTVESVMIEGHCDSVGSRAYNYALSDRRAKAVQKLLVDNGLRAASIRTCIGFGKDKPLQQLEAFRNRRVIVHYTVREALTRPKTTASPAPKPQAIPLDEMGNTVLQAGQKIALDKLFFFGGRHVLREESLPVVIKLCRLLESHPNVKVEIQGHVCCTTFEPDGYDYDLGTDNLSVTRAKAIYQYLIRCGISPERLRYKGFGGSRKVVLDETSEEDRQKNRRVELEVWQD